MRMFMESEAVTMQLLHEAGCTVPMAYFAPIEYAELGELISWVPLDLPVWHYGHIAPCPR